MDPNEVSIKILRDDGVFLLLDGTGAMSDADLGITAIEGLDSPDIQIFSQQKARGDGSFITRDRYGEREITIEASCKTNDDALRRRLVSFFNTKKVFRLDITYRSTTRWIEGKVSGKSVPSGNVYELPEVTVSFRCPDPFLKSTVGNIDTFSTKQKAFSFPYKNLVGSKFVTGIITAATEKYILNHGDVDVLPFIVVEFSGEVSKPKIILGDAYIEIDRTFSGGETLTIDCATGAVTMGGTNILNKVVPGSTTIGLTLKVGDTYCKNQAQTGVEFMNTTIYRDINYLGL